ncbi:polyketide synthase dehydratase domain-containing protein [Kutzneria kofuensis]
MYAEVQLPEGADAERFSLHPALLDAALHVFRADRRGRRPGGGCRSPGRT